MFIGTKERLGDLIVEQERESILGSHLKRTTMPETTVQEQAISDELLTAIAEGWDATYSLLFDRPTRPFVKNLGAHHREAIKWHWTARHRVCRLERQKRNLSAQLAQGTIPQHEHDLTLARLEATQGPRYYAYFPIWSRGHMKSTIARRLAVVDAIIALYYGVRSYCLYVGGTNDKTKAHAKSIDRLLKNFVKIHAPSLATKMPASEDDSRSMGWTGTFFYTAAGCVFHFGSLQSGLAGGNLDDVRPTMIILDDIDDRSLSIAQAESNFNLLTSEILPMGADGTLTFWAQNLINRYSCMYRVYKERDRVLVDRKRTKPIPAIEGLKTEARADRKSGIVQDVIIEGTATWPHFNLAMCQREINRMGLESFMRECQHDVEQSRKGLMLHKYDDKVHVISESEFAAVHGSRDAYKTWAKWGFHDYARTKTKFHACVAGYVTVSSASARNPGFTFLIHPMSFGENAEAEDIGERMLSVLSPRAIDDYGNELQTWAELRADTLHRANVPRHVSSVTDKIEYERSRLAEIIPQYASKVLKNWNMKGGAMSHSENTIRNNLRRIFALNLSPSNPGKTDAIDDINRAMQIDYTIEHPYRPGQLGYARWFIIVPDWTDCPKELIRIGDDGQEIFPPVPYKDALKPDDLHDHDLIRYQFMNWRARDPKLTDAGEDVETVLKLDDDFGQGLQMLYFKKLMANEPITDDEKVEEHMPENLKAEVIAAIEDPQQRSNALQARLQKIRQVQKGIKQASTPVSPGIRRLRKR
jgi:hypothetical protein